MAQTSQKPKRGPLHWIGCALQVPLGCMAFLLGAAAVCFAFLPFAGGGLLSAWAKEDFGEAHFGELELSDAWIGSFYGGQEIGGISLRDGEGQEILRGSLEAPSLRTLFFSSMPEWGPVLLHLERVDLRRDSQGRWNLLEALRTEEDTSNPDETRSRSTSVRFGSDRSDVGKRILFELVVDRLLASDADGVPFEIQDLHCRGAARLEASDRGGDAKILRFDGTGRGLFQSDPDRPIGLAWNLALGDGSVAWRVSLDAKRIDRRAVATPVPYVDVALARIPEELDTFHVVLSQEGSEAPLRIELEAGAQGFSFTLGGDLLPDTGRIQSREGDRIVVGLDPFTQEGELVIQSLLPFISGVEPSSTGPNGTLPRAELSIEDFVVDLVNPPLLPKAAGTLDLGGAKLRVGASYRKLLPMRPTTRLSGPCRLVLRGGALSYQTLGYEAIGGVLRVTGSRAPDVDLEGLVLRFPDGEILEVEEGRDGCKLRPVQDR